MTHISFGPLSLEAPFTGSTEDRIFQMILAEQSSIGYYQLPDAPIDDILFFAAADTHKEVVVIGIGGSSLGAKAIYNLLKHSTGNLKPLHFLESTDPVSLLANIARIDIPNAIFLVISKSGNTTETMSVYKYLLSLGSIEKSSIVVVTDEGSPLHGYAKSQDIRAFHLPSNVGGRFSVLSAVGLLPLALSGVDVRGLLSGAWSVKTAFFEDALIRESLLSKASFYGKNHAKYSINTLFSYADGLKHFNEWYIQLWGESLGKIQRDSEKRELPVPISVSSFNVETVTTPHSGTRLSQEFHHFWEPLPSANIHVGLTPIGITGPVDQHSFLQLIVEGPRDKTMTFIKVKDFGCDIAVPDISLQSLESLDIFNSLPFERLINMQADAIIEQLSGLEIPLDTIELSRLDAENIGALMFYYELLTSLTGAVMDIYPYDQPGVEDGKKILKRNVLAMQEGNGK